MAQPGFEDLEVYKAARQLRKMIYRLANKLPESERFGFAQRMKRVALSLTNNLTESHGRVHYQEGLLFCRKAQRYLSELMDGLNTCVDKSYYSKSDCEPFKRQAQTVQRLLNVYMGEMKDRFHAAG